MSKRLAVLTVAAAMGVWAGMATAQTAEDVFGTWSDPKTGGNLEVYKCGEAMCAKISMVPPGKEGAKDVNNADETKRDRLLLGLVVVENATKKDDTTWAGSIYDRERGKNFDATFTSRDKATLDITGCVLSLLCKTTTLTRVQ